MTELSQYEMQEEREEAFAEGLTEGIIKMALSLGIVERNQLINLLIRKGNFTKDNAIKMYENYLTKQND